jgi:hypothetical protein
VMVRDTLNGGFVCSGDIGSAASPGRMAAKPVRHCQQGTGAERWRDGYTDMPSWCVCSFRSCSSRDSSLRVVVPAWMFPAPPLPMECTSPAAGSRERERSEMMFPTPPRPEECYSGFGFQNEGGGLGGGMLTMVVASACSRTSLAWRSTSATSLEGSWEGERMFPAPPRPTE